jgi:hypothetical protein
MLRDEWSQKMSLAAYRANAHYFRSTRERVKWLRVQGARMIAARLENEMRERAARIIGETL